jgi:hypothetical protein
MEENITSTPKPRTITLGGKDYELPIFDLNLMDAIENTFGCSIENISQEYEKRRAGTTKRLLVLLLSKYEMTPDKIGELVTMENLAEVSSALAKVLGG